MEKEVWKDVPGYEGRYQVSNLGRAKSLKRKVWNGKVYFDSKEIILKPHDNGHGYMMYQFHLGKNKYKHIYAHRLVLITFIGKKDGLQCNHLNGIRSDNRLENLEWVTVLENNLHRNNVLGNHSRGERSGTSKLKEKDVLEIQKALNNNENQRKIAEKYKVSLTTIGRIKRKERWQHLLGK